MLPLAITCPHGMVYQQCGSLCPQTCEYLGEVCEGGCSEGCFCPIGQVLINGTCQESYRCTGMYVNNIV